jgi:hypothetical protein
MRNPFAFSLLVAVFCGLCLLCGGVQATSEGDSDTETVCNLIGVGIFADVHVEVREDGSLYAKSICFETDEERDDPDDAEESAFEAQIESIADDGSSFTVLGSLVVVLVEENGDDDGEEVDDDDDDNGDDDFGQLSIGDLEVGDWVEVEGVYSSEDGIFYAEEIGPHDDLESSIESVITEVDGNIFKMLGLVIEYGDGTVLSRVIYEENEDEESDIEDEDND